MRPSKATGPGTVGVPGARRGDLDLATQSAAQARPQSPETQSPGGGAQSAVTPLAIALDYIGRGWNAVPVPFRMKKPVDDDWQRRIITEVTAAAHFNSGSTVNCSGGPRKIVTARQVPRICPWMISLCSRFDFAPFTPKMLTIDGYSNFSRSPQAWVQARRVDGVQVHDPTPTSASPELPRAGGHSCATMRRRLLRLICAWFRP